MDGWPSEETLDREAFRVGEPAIDRARSALSMYQYTSSQEGPRDILGTRVCYSG